MKQLQRISKNLIIKKHLGIVMLKSHSLLDKENATVPAKGMPLCGLRIPSQPEPIRVQWPTRKVD